MLESLEAPTHEVIYETLGATKPKKQFINRVFGMTMSKWKSMKRDASTITFLSEKNAGQLANLYGYEVKSRKLSLLPERSISKSLR